MAFMGADIYSETCRFPSRAPHQLSYFDVSNDEGGSVGKFAWNSPVIFFMWEKRLSKGKNGDSRTPFFVFRLQLMHNKARTMRSISMDGKILCAFCILGTCFYVKFLCVFCLVFDWKNLQKRDERCANVKC